MPSLPTFTASLRRPLALAAAAALPLIVVAAFLVPSEASGAEGAVVPANGAGAAPVDLAQLSITVTTTSDWTKLHVSPATARFASVTSNPAGVSATKIADGVALSGVPAAGATVTFNVLAEDLTGASLFTAMVEKGARGTTTATVVNTSSTPFTVSEVTDQLTTKTTTNAVTASLTRAQLFGTVEPTLPHADPRHLVLAFSYPWYTVRTFDGPRVFDEPASGAYSSWDSVAALDMATQARANGIDGFIMSWSGNDRDGPQFDLTLKAASATNGYATGYLETMVANTAHDESQPADPKIVRAWLDQLLSRSSNPAFLTSGGVPVVFVYGMYRLPVTTWAQILSDEAAAGHAVRLVGDGSLPAYSNVMWGSHLYNPNQMTYDDLSTWNHGRLVAERGAASVDPSVAPKLYAATVSPGFDNRKAKTAAGTTGTSVDRENGARYQLTWDAALSHDPDWVLVTTWNEWYEGTAIQPGVLTGDLALQQTKANADKF